MIAATNKSAVLAALPAAKCEVNRALPELSENGVRRIIDRLHDAGKAYIGAWKWSALGGRMAVYYPGPGVDVPFNLAPFVKAVKPVIAEHSSTRYWVDRARVSPHHWASALFGATA